MKNQPVAGNGKKYELPVQKAGEFHSFISGLWNMFDDHSAKQVTISETPQNIKVTAELPNIDEKDIEIQISADGYLTISGEKKQQIEHNGDFSETSYGMFRRTVYLPWNLDYSTAEADYADGILNIAIPKKELSAKIAIKSKKLPKSKKKTTSAV